MSPTQLLNALLYFVLGILAMLATLPQEIINVLPPAWKPRVILIVMLAGWIKSHRNLFTNPDGTSARAPWEPKDK